MTSRIRGKGSGDGGSGEQRGSVVQKAGRHFPPHRRIAKRPPLMPQHGLLIPGADPIPALQNGGAKNKIAAATVL